MALDASNKQEIANQATSICSKYLGTGGEDPVLNLAPHMQREIMNKLKKPTTDMFASSKQDIEQLLKTGFVQFADS
jgi:hypothetical protein